MARPLAAVAISRLTILFTASDLFNVARLTAEQFTLGTMEREAIYLPLGAATWPPHISMGSRRARGKFPVFRSLWAISSLLVGITLLIAPTAAEAFDPHLPIAAPQASEGCCGMDQDDTFRGYTVELWDEAPTVSELNCPDQDEACLLSEADRISRVYRLQQALVERAALERSRHFSKEPLGAGLFQ